MGNGCENIISMKIPKDGACAKEKQFPKTKITIAEIVTLARNWM